MRISEENLRKFDRSYQQQPDDLFDMSDEVFTAEMFDDVPAIGRNIGAMAVVGGLVTAAPIIGMGMGTAMQSQAAELPENQDVQAVYVDTSESAEIVQVIDQIEDKTVYFSTSGPGHVEPESNCVIDADTGEIRFIDPDSNACFRIVDDVEGAEHRIHMDGFTLPADTDMIVLEAHSDYGTIQIEFDDSAVAEAERVAAQAEQEAAEEQARIDAQKAAERAAAERAAQEAADRQRAAEQEAAAAASAAAAQQTRAQSSQTQAVQQVSQQTTQQSTQRAAQSQSKTQKASTSAVKTSTAQKSSSAAAQKSSSSAKKTAAQKKTSSASKSTQKTQKSAATTKKVVKKVVSQKTENTTPASGASKHAMTADELEVARGIFDSYNDYRASKGLSKVAWSDDCANMAYGSVTGCASTGALKHRLGIPLAVQKNYSDILQYSTWKPSSAEAVNRWVKSDGHRKMMQCETAEVAGVAAYNNGGTWYYAIVYNFSGTNQNGK